MSNQYDHSEPTHFNISSDSREFTSLISVLTDLVIAELKLKHNVKRVKRHDVGTTLRAVVAALTVTKIQDSSRYLTYNRNKSWYSKDSRYNPKRFSYTIFINVVDALTSLGFIETKLGFYDKGGVNSRLSRMIATDLLMAQVNSFTLKLEHFRENQEPEVILLKGTKSKGGKKPLIDYADTKSTNRYRAVLSQINLRLAETEITLCTRGLEPTLLSGLHAYDVKENRLVRIFNNGDFEQGGRFYHGWWQEIPSRYRSLLRINGKRTVEMDYSAIHFTLLYAEKKLPVPTTDLYQVDGVERSVAKKILNIALNASSLKSATGAVKTKLLPESTSGEIIKTIKKCIDKHRAISEFFFTGKGLHLQFIDSQVAEDVMVNMWENWGEVVLPVHDSFIVRRGLWSQLEKQMHQSFKRVIGYDCKVKVERKDDELKTKVERLAQQVAYDYQGNIVKAGVNIMDLKELITKR